MQKLQDKNKSRIKKDTGKESQMQKMLKKIIQAY